MTNATKTIQEAEKIANSLSDKGEILVIFGWYDKYINTLNVSILEHLKNGEQRILYYCNTRKLLFCRYSYYSSGGYILKNFVEEINPEKACYLGFNPKNFLDLMTEIK